MNAYALGNESDNGKIYYFLFLFIVYAVLFFFYIGANAVDKGIIRFYMMFGLILGFIPLLIDYFINKNKELPLDTISYENNSIIPFFNNSSVQLISAFLLGALTFLKIKFTQEAFIQAPQFHISLFSINSKFANAFLSGITGGVFETIVFFGFLFPTLYAVFKKTGFNEWSSLFWSVLVTSGFFTLFHYWRYAYLITALVSVFVFAVLMCLLTYAYKSTIPAMVVHFMNNFLVIVLVVQGFRILMIGG